MTGSRTPFSISDPRSSTTNTPATRRCVAAVITTVSGSAALCTRAAMLAVSPKIEPHAVRQLELRVQRPHCVEHREPGADRALGVVLARRRPAEVDEEPVAEKLRHVATEPLDRRARRCVVA